MRISDGSSDVCSSDLSWALSVTNNITAISNLSRQRRHEVRAAFGSPLFLSSGCREREDRKSVVWGKSVSVRVDLGVRRSIKKKIKSKQTIQHKSKITQILMITLENEILLNTIR